jgi:hypothetical protein
VAQLHRYHFCQNRVWFRLRDVETAAHLYLLTMTLGEDKI